MIWLVVGQALNYLGITDGKLLEYSGWKRDSLYTPQGNSGFYSVKVETLLVNQSFLYNGYPGKGIYTAIHYQSSQSVFEDTVYEVADSLRRLYEIGKNFDCSLPYKVDIKAIVTPFSQGNKWRLGLGGPYIGDFDGDCSTNYTDTLWWNIDTATVVSQENITVPAGSFNTYKIWIRLKGQIWSSVIKEQAGNFGFNPKSDSIVRNYYIWWAVNIGYVKDSLYTFVRFSGPFNSSIRSISWEVSELQSVSMSIAEKRKRVLFSKGVMKFNEHVKIYDISGKVVFEGKGFVRLNRGVYFIRDSKDFIKAIVN